MSRPGMERPASGWANFTGFHEEAVVRRMEAAEGTCLTVFIVPAQGSDTAMPAAFLQARSSTPRGGIRCLAPDASWFDVTWPWSALSFPSTGW